MVTTPRLPDPADMHRPLTPRMPSFRRGRNERTAACSGDLDQGADEQLAVSRGIIEHLHF